MELTLCIYQATHLQVIKAQYAQVVGVPYRHHQGHTVRQYSYVLDRCRILHLCAGQSMSMEVTRVQRCLQRPPSRWCSCSCVCKALVYLEPCSSSSSK